MANLRITAQCSCPTAGHVGKGHVESTFEVQMSCVCKAALHAFAEDGQPLPQLGKALMASIAGDDFGFGVAVAQNQRFAAWCGTAIEKILAPRRKLRNELRAL